MAKHDPSTRSSDYEAMFPYWEMLAAIMGGVRGMRAGGKKYLPQFDAEPAEKYKLRLDNARMTNVFSDVVDNLARRPFQKPVMLTDESSEEFKEFAKDVNGRGDDLHVFTGKLFRAALNDGLTWLLVDYTRKPSAEMSLAQEREMGARPLWVHYAATDAIAVYADRIDGVEQFIEARFYEYSIERDGFEEKKVERIRVFQRPPGAVKGEYGPAQWSVWRKAETAEQRRQGNQEDWFIEQGPFELGIETIPLVAIVFGERKGGSWRVDPPMRDAAYLQVELYQQENGLKHIRNATAYPMLAANGMEPELGADNEPKPVVVGPNAVLWGGKSDSGPGGSWTYVEPSAQSLQFLREDVRDTIREIRELGRQPLTVQSGNLTVITTAVAAKKGNTVVQAWVGILTHEIEQAFSFTAQWFNLVSPKVGVAIYTDFDLGIGDDESFKQVLELGTIDAPLISREAVLSEAQRRGILGPNYNAEEDLKLLERSPGEDEIEE